MSKNSLVIFLFFLFSLELSASDTLQRPPFTVFPVAEKIRFDGIPDEADWQRAAPLRFHVLEPVWGAPPAEKTDIRFLYDADNLYVGAKFFYRDPSKIIRRNFVRDGWRGDDWVAVHIDSRFDHQTAINFAIYPAGSKFDMLISNDAVDLGGSATNSSFNAVWDARSVITNEGWFFEMKIPLYNLRYSIDSAGMASMAISVTRWTAYNNELQHSVRIPQGTAAGFMRPSLKQEARFEGLKKHKLLLVTPYVAASTVKSNPFDEDKGKIITERSNRLTAGLDAKIGISQQLTLDATVNPDFGQAEADLQQLNLSRFGLYLPERRLFFQEQSGLFDFGIGNTTQLFYSRRIGLSDDGVIPLYGGLRLTGQLGKTIDIGLLNMQAADKRFTDSAKVKSENFGVMRLRKKVFNDRSFIGLLFTGRNNGDVANYAVGTDAVVNLVRNQYLKIGVAATNTRESGKSSTTGIASSRVSVGWENLSRKGWVPRFSYTYSGRNFDPGLGFLDRTDFHNVQGRLTYGVFANSDKQFLSQQRYSLNASEYINATSGRMESMSNGVEWLAYTVKGGSFTMNATMNYEYVKDSIKFGNDVVVRSGSYHFPYVSFLMSPPEASKLAFPIGFGAGGFFDGQRYFFSVSPNFNSAIKWHVQPGYDYTYLNFPSGSHNKNTHIHIARLNVLYAPDLHFSVAANVQYNSAEGKVFSNFRLRYNFSDGHDLYVVWNSESRTSRWMNGVKVPVMEEGQFLVKYYYMIKW